MLSPGWLHSPWAPSVCSDILLPFNRGMLFKMLNVLIGTKHCLTTLNCKQKMKRSLMVEWWRLRPWGHEMYCPWSGRHRGKLGVHSPSVLLDWSQNYLDNGHWHWMCNINFIYSTEICAAVLATYISYQIQFASDFTEAETWNSDSSIIISDDSVWLWSLNIWL